MQALKFGGCLGLMLLVAGCGGRFTDPGEPGHAGMAGSAGSATGGTGAGGSATGGTTATGGTSGNGGTECKVDGDCPVSKVGCELCADGSSACPWARCEAGQCTGGIDRCPASECKTDGDCPISKAPCELCADGSSACPWSRCDAGMCSAGIDTCPVASLCSEPCADGDTCVYQVGGPGGAEGFHCATQLPCKSPALCACIVNEGTCTYMSGTPGYCQCDNGLE